MISQFVKKVSGVFLVVALIIGCVSLALAIDPKGRPKGMGPNAASGYYVWQDEKGWHLRTISGNQPRKFEGEIICDGGSVNDLRQYRDEAANWFTQQGSKIKINLSTDKNIDGLDFQVSGGSLTFDLRVDDRSDASIVHVGSASENPSGIPFTVQVK